MKVNWVYDENDYKEGGNYETIPPGSHRVRIEVAEETTSRSGKPMIKLVLSVSGYESRLWDYIVLDGSSPEAKQRTNNKLGSIFDSFDIPHGNMDIKTWEGKSGAVDVKHETYNGSPSPKVKWYIRRKKQTDLPPWKENGGIVKNDAVPADIPFDPDSLL